jgi:hypothetical protein
LLNFNNNIGFKEKRQLFRRKLATIPEKCEQYIDHSLGENSIIGTFQRWRLQLRVHRLGEFSPFWATVYVHTLGICKIMSVALNFGLLFHRKSSVLNWKSMGLVTFLATL